MTNQTQTVQPIAPPPPRSAPSPDLSMPHHTGAEQTVLANLLRDPALFIGGVLEAGGKDLFYIPAHQYVYEAIASLFDDGRPVDLLTLGHRLAERGTLEDTGGQQGLRILFDLSVQKPLPLDQFPDWCAALRDLWVRRELIRLSMSVIRRSLRQEDRPGDILDQAESGLLDVRDCFWTPRTRPARGWVLDVIRGIETSISHPGQIAGLATGFRDLDHAISGLHEGELVLIAGSPGAGKTALAANLASHIAVERTPRIPVGWFTCQESGSRAMQRVLSLHAGMDLHQMMGRGLTDKEELNRLVNTASSVAESPLLIHEEPVITTMELRHLARGWKRQDEVGLILVDGLHSLKTQRRDGVPLRLADAAAALKGMARELAVPVIAFADAPVPPRHRRPGLQDLGELREAVAESDVVMWLEEAQREPQTGLIGSNLHILKQRHGPSSSIRLQLVPDQLRMEDWPAASPAPGSSADPRTQPPQLHAPDVDVESLYA